MDRYPKLQPCPICTLQDASGFARVGDTDTYEVTCATCGKYRVRGGENPEPDLAKLSPPRRARLIRAVRERRGTEPPLATPTSIPQLIASVRNISSSARRRGVLLLLDDLSEHPGQYIPREWIRERWLDIGLVMPDEFVFWSAQLARQGLLTSDSGGFRLTPEGVLECEVLANSRRDLSQVFVAMAFGTTEEARATALTVYREGLRMGIEGREPNSTGLHAKRIDMEETNNKLCEEIILEIRRSRAIVADITHERPNVYYEAGYAHGLGLPVIFTCEASHFRPHFDTQQYKTILWTDPQDLAKQLEVRIRVTVSEGGAS